LGPGPAPGVRAHSAPIAEVARRLGSDPESGLPEAEAGSRLARVGPNTLERRTRPPYLVMAGRQLADPLVGLLLAAVVVSAAIGDRVEAVAIGVIVLLNAMLGFGQELGAERAVRARVRRFGEART
jgi:magnesium-transporting ATPase (P-type)